MTIFHYIHRLDVTEEYNFIFLSTDEYRVIYSLELYFSVTSLVNRGILHIFVGCEDMFIGYNQ
jgi:hypothetical protein